MSLSASATVCIIVTAKNSTVNIINNHLLLVVTEKTAKHKLTVAMPSGIDKPRFDFYTSRMSTKASRRTLLQSSIKVPGRHVHAFK